jgi:hypothetical protein
MLWKIGIFLLDKSFYMVLKIDIFGCVKFNFAKYVNFSPHKFRYASPARKISVFLQLTKNSLSFQIKKFQRFFQLKKFHYFLFNSKNSITVDSPVYAIEGTGKISNKLENFIRLA